MLANAAARSFVALAVGALAIVARAEGQRAPSPTGYWPSQTCAGCHPRTVEQHMQSHHESSFRSPLFQAQYFEELLPRASRDPSLIDEARTCTACHAPVAWSFQRQHLSGAMPTDPSMSGVTCDLCHTITGYDGPEPRNGNFISAPSDRKLGPFPSRTNWHHVYSKLQTQSELCATCHEAVNHHGLPVKTTYTEWRKSRFPALGIQCQDCHMTRDGFLGAGGQGRFESGKAAEGASLSAPVRDRLYTHRFPGAHSRAQVEGAITIAFAKVPAKAKAGEPISFTVMVDNHRSGHKMPTGSADLRLLWLEVTARHGQKSVPVPANVKALGGYGTAGSGEIDDQLLGKDVPPGSRLYRAVFFDANRQTLSSYDALRVVWDNRLDAGEKRNEPYDLVVPGDAGGTMQLEARLVYLAYPTSFAKRWEVPPAEPVEVASAVARVEVARSPAPPPPATPPPAASPAPTRGKR